MDNWQLWFVRLSGWPVFITVIIAGVLVGWLASVLLTKAASRSAVQTMLFAVIAIALIGLLLVLIAVGLTRGS
jgi:LytS/YehU family sensor histidine kinase